MPAGRPTDYRPEYGQEIIDLMATGLSLTAAAADLGFHRQRVYEWAEHHPEFADAVKLARAKRVLALERGLLEATEGPRVTARIFALKNADPEEWREKVVNEHTGKDGGPIETADATDPKKRARALALLLAEAAHE
jgi:hypothetical protein